MGEVTIKHYGKIVKGVKYYYNKNLYAQNLSELEGKEFEEVFKKKHKRVSLDAHGYYRGGVLGTALDSEMFGGWDRDDIHDFFAKMYLSYTKALVIKYVNGSEKLVNIKK